MGPFPHSAPRATMEAMIADFQAMHPDLNIETTVIDREAYKTQIRNFLTADDSGYLLRSLTDPRIASSSFSEPLQVSQLATLFDEVWEQATPDIEALRLHL